MEDKKKWSGWILIAGILLITIIVLGINTLSSARSTADTTLQKYESTFLTLFEHASSFERADNGEGEFIYAAAQGGNPLGYAVQQTVQGYAGPVEVITALSQDGTILGIHVGGSEFKETEGLGGKARDAAFTDQFEGKMLPVTLGQDIDAIAGATVTSQAVVDAVNQSAERLSGVPGFTLTPAATVAPASDDASGMTANASAIGYGGPVLVRLTLDEQGKIAALDVGGARFSETEGVGSRVKEDSFTQSFIGLTPPLSLGEQIDAVSGATISSRAVVEAVNDAAAFLMQNNGSSDTN